MNKICRIDITSFNSESEVEVVNITSQKLINNRRYSITKKIDVSTIENECKVDDFIRILEKEIDILRKEGVKRYRIKL